MMFRQKLAELVAALSATFPVPIIFGYGVARLFGIWIGIGAGIGVAVLCVAAMMLLWHTSRRWNTAMDSAMTNLARLQRRMALTELLMLGLGILAFGWIGAALVLIIGDPESRRNMFRIFSCLWFWLAPVPLCALSVCWLWRLSLKRKIAKIDFHDTTRAS